MTPVTRKKLRTATRLLLGAFVTTAGIGHLSFARKDFQAQVPNWVPLQKDDTVVYSGYVEIALGLALLAAPKKYRQQVGTIAATFFVAVFPGNLAQYNHHRDALGMDTDTKRLVRLFFQPVLMYAAVAGTKPEPLAELRQGNVKDAIEA
ncbi:MAG: hypothetical protein EOP52_09285 [Sphingobacteriales bacterium]|nr:MAG: hypothetical protein EOP52_09285 [Sphingobacteriales bacterium]